jgi:hypothetical protein
LEDRCLLTALASPGTVAYNFGGISYVDTFAVGEDASLKDAEWANDGSGWAFHWNDLGRPNGVAVFSPAVVTYTVGSTVYVSSFVVGPDGSLKEGIFANDGVMNLVSRRKFKGRHSRCDPHRSETDTSRSRSQSPKRCGSLFRKE